MGDTQAFRSGLTSRFSLAVVKTVEARSRSSAFHWVIWFGWTSKRSASCASVCLPFTAAKATFALKAAEWFLRVVSSSMLLSGRLTLPIGSSDFTYPGARISGARSVAFTRTLAAQYAQNHIRANAIAPGLVRSERQLKRWLDANAGCPRFDGISDGIQPNEPKERYAQQGLSR